MSDIDVTQQHTLSPEAARQAIEALVAKLAQEFSVQSSWAGDVVSLNGSGVKGQVALLPGKVQVTADLSFPASLMKGTVQEKITRALKENLA